MRVWIVFPLIGGLCACQSSKLLTSNDRPYEVWLVDQSDSPGVSYGGTLRIFDGVDLEGSNASAATPTETINLSGPTAALCMAQTGANPVRPHMLLFNREHTHAVLSFVASGHVLLMNAATRQPLACMRTTQSATGRQAHAAFPSPDGAYIVVANQNGKRLERINVNFATNGFTHDTAATLDLATCMTPSQQPCQADGVRPDNAPICPVIDAGSTYAYVTLRGGGLFIVNIRSTPMQIVAEYDMTKVKGNGCGGTQVGNHMYINSGGRPGNLAHLSLYGFDVYRFPTAVSAGSPNTPAPEVVYSIAGEHDSHGMVATRDGAHVWVLDRHANAAEIIATGPGRRVNTVALAGSLASDPAPDLVDISPKGSRLFVALRGATPLSGDPHIATGNSPGLGIVEVDANGAGGRLAAVIRIANVDAAGVDRADAHAVRVRLK